MGQVPPDCDRASIVLSGTAPPDVRVAELVSVTVATPVSPVSGIGVVVAASDTRFVNESPTAVGSPVERSAQVHRQHPGGVGDGQRAVGGDRDRVELAR